MCTGKNIKKLNVQTVASSFKESHHRKPQFVRPHRVAGGKDAVLMVIQKGFFELELVWRSAEEIKKIKVREFLRTLGVLRKHVHFAHRF
jgi:hypothetical protein